ncbi:MAG: hypothetical protein DA330_04390 [Nitrososphaera sp.]|nr:hypothetical protein [Nitrososphaera sp.]
MSKRQTVVILSIAAVAIAVAFLAMSRQQDVTVAQNNPGNGSITIITISSGSLLSGATYSISPNPFTAEGSLTIQDNGKDDSDSTAGLIVLSGLQNGRFVVTQSQAPAGYDRDKLSKVIDINDDSQAVTFSNIASVAAADKTLPTSVTYTAKFECGRIPDNRGPLRPGHYDTDIGILNKQEFEVRMTWQAIVNDGRTSNLILKTLQPQTATGIVCQDLKKALVGNDEFSEGFVLISVPLDSSLLGAISGGSTVVRSGSIDILDVQVFYTANALDSLPHEVLVDKIVFTISADPSGKIPKEMLNKTLDVTVNSDLNQISDPEVRVREQIAEKYGLSEQQAVLLEIRIDGISVGVGTMIDDHALSLSRVPPQATG